MQLSAYSNLALNLVLHEKITGFFDSLHKALKSGTKPDELLYNVNFSKPSVKRLFDSWSDRDARAGIEKVYMRVEKHFAETPDLKPVVWASIKDNFLKTSTTFSQDFKRVYGNDVVIPFDMQNLISFVERQLHQ
jgi:exocyst complex component 1